MVKQRMGDLLGSAAAGLGAVAARRAAVSVFEAGGRHLLDESSRSLARRALDMTARAALGAFMPVNLGQLAGEGVARVVSAASSVGGARLAAAAEQALASEPVSRAVAGLTHAAEQATGKALERAADTAMKPGLRRTAGAVVDVVGGKATDRITAAARRSAAAGAVIDGVRSVLEVRGAHERGDITTRQAVVRVAIGAGTGALAAGAGVAIGAGAVAVLGGLGAPAVFVVGAAGSMGTRRAFRWLFSSDELEAEHAGPALRQA